ncbi:hypothetical protein [Streptomyces sp. NPDC048057]|uniref:hypothetical protein n=1 Tax=Streptomyces sp. NPDC048057 TaxID=3155628 RepID=UPI003410F8AF
MNDDGTARWDARAQRWERDEEPVPYTAPPPPFPLLPPQWDPSATASALPTVKIGPDGEVVPGPPPATRRRRRGRTAAVVVASMAAVAAVATTIWYAVEDDGSAGARPGASASASDGANGSGDPSEGLDRTDYTVTQADGYTLAVPDGWQRNTDSSSIYYTDPQGDGVLMVMDHSTSSDTPLDLVTKSDNVLTGQSGYRQVELGYVTSGEENPSDDAAELTYQFQRSTSDEMRTCIERAFTADDSDVHVVFICGSTSDMPFQRRLMTTVLKHFDPPGS